MPEVALRLRDSIGWEPVLWISYADQEARAREVFPGTPWQDLEDAFVGIPVPGVNSEQPPALDEGWMLRLQHYLPTLMNQMNRFGPPDHFLYDEREAFARRLFFQWHEVLVRTRAEVVFFEEPPNAPYNYVLYALCREMGVRVVYLNATAMLVERCFVREEIEGAPLRLAEALERRIARGADEDLPETVKAAVASVTEGDRFEHWYMKGQAAHAVKTAAEKQELAAEPARRRRDLAGRALSRWWRVWRWPAYVRYLREERHRIENWRASSAKSVRVKFPGRPIDDRDSTYGELDDYRMKAEYIKESLRADYLRRCEEPDFSGQPYVYFPLHYRPERTSNPDGGVFYDQLIPLAMISDALPDGWALYVKEHPSQFSSMLAGECGRTTAYYDDIARLRNVRLIAPDVSSRDLLLNAKAAASITGTVVWEAVLNRTPAFYFGFPWYQGCPGTRRTTSSEEVAFLLGDLDGAVATDDELKAFLHAVHDASFEYTQNGWTMDPSPATDEQQFDGLVSALEWWHAERFLSRATVDTDEANAVSTQ
jgi:hypothetical protein